MSDEPREHSVEVSCALSVAMLAADLMLTSERLLELERAVDRDGIDSADLDELLGLRQRRRQLLELATAWAGDHPVSALEPA